MSNKIELPDGLGLCDDCKEEFDLDELEKCSGCNMILCKYCLDIHSNDHYIEEHYPDYEEEMEKKYGTKKENWD